MSPATLDQPVTAPDPSSAASRVRSLRRRRRARGTTVNTVLAVAGVGLVLYALTLGDFPLTVRETIDAALDPDAGPARLALVEFRLPRLVLAVLVGIAFGLAGALFQAVLRNPLASPDVIGISQGASAGAVLALLLLGAGGATLSWAALIGGATVAVLLYAVAWRGGLTGYRFVLAGIGMAYVCAAVVGYVLTRSEVDGAGEALIWLSGSTADASWSLNRVLALALLVLVPLALLVGRRLDLLMLGDDQAATLGLRPELVRFAVIVLGVALACAATAAAGPVAFVALVAPPVARRLLDDGGAALLTSALVGVVLVVGADLVAQFVLPTDISVPVGVVTGAIGGPYLIWMMATGRSRRT